MPITTPLNNYPYLDDFNVDKSFYKILFKPETSVQVRELNQLQSILQNQIEKFGDNIFVRGTILEGCNFNFNNSQPYVKLSDNEQDGSITIPSLYMGNFVKNQANLRAFVVDYTEGFETTAPDLKTIYVNYINSGNTGNLTSFSPGDTLTVFDSKNSIFKVNVLSGGLGFSNTDEIVFTSKIAVQTTVGSFSNGDYLIDTAFGAKANVQIVSVDEITLASIGYTLIEIKPRSVDLYAEDTTSNNWTFSINTNVKNISNTASGTVLRVYGQNAKAKITTLGSGQIDSVSILNRGQDYEYSPYVSVKSVLNSSYINSIDLKAQNFLTEVKIPTATDSVGFGYIFNISDGWIFQKGYILKVDQQSSIISRYNTSPNNVVAGFSSFEEIIDSNQDTSLLDNATGENSESGPGADRLKLTPQITVISKDIANANSEFFSLVEWNEGNPYKQNQQTVYTRIGATIAESTYESEGNFVLDRFNVTTQSPSNSNNEGKYYSVVVDPGLAYINGYKVKTLNNFKFDIEKSTDTKQANSTFSLNYGSYINVKEFGGSFKFNTAANVDLYDTSKGFLSNSSLYLTGNTSPVGNKIGTAKLRSFVSNEGTPGLSSASYRLYIFDIQMNSGKNFKNVKSVSSNTGIADVIQEYDNVTGNSLITILKDVKSDGLLFPSGVASIKNSNATNYFYRTIDESVLVSNTGALIKTISDTNEFFSHQGALSTPELRDLILIPTSNNLVQYSTLSGTVNAVSSNNIVVGSGTNFFNDFVAGDYAYINDGTSNDIHRVISVDSATQLTLDGSLAFSNGTSNIRRVFPKNIPIPFGARDGLSASIDVTRKNLTLSFAHANGAAIVFAGPSTTSSLSFNIKRENVASSTKTSNRNKFVKINIANNSGGVSGPWCLGMPDILRLRKVYVANTTNVNSSSTEVTSKFYIDHNQTSNYLGLGYLYAVPKSGVALASTDCLLIEFDYFTQDNSGYFDAKSYRRTSDANTIFATDSLSLANLTSAAHSFEIPEVYTSDGQDYDLINVFDFRPSVSATAIPSSAAVDAPINPSEQYFFSQVSEKKFPLPDSYCETNIEYYLGRYDDVYVSEKNNIYVLKGIPSDSPSNRSKAEEPKDSLKLNTLNVPPYPDLPQNLSDSLQEVVTTRIANERYSLAKNDLRVISSLFNSLQLNETQPIRYTHKDVGDLEKRVADLEYYVRLSLLEAGMANKTITSSIDSTVNRFKYGFFVDDFSTLSYTDINNPQFSASIEVVGNANSGVSNTVYSVSNNSIAEKSTNRMVPVQHTWSASYKDTDNLPYVDYMVLSQGVATISNTSSACIPNNVTTYTNTVSNGYFTTSFGSRFAPYQTSTVQLANIAGPVTYYFDNYGIPNKIEIYQNNILIADSSQAGGKVSNLTQNDINFIKTDSNARTFYTYGVVSTFTPFQWDDPHRLDQVVFSGKITFNHIPANGLNYTIKIYAHHPTGNLSKGLLVYPKLISSEATIVDVNNCGITTPVPVYSGTIVLESHLSWFGVFPSKYLLGVQQIGSYKLYCTGLKPSTKHTFTVNGGLNNTEKIVQNSPMPTGIAATDGSLYSNEEGKLEFTVYKSQNPSDWYIVSRNMLGIIAVNTILATPSVLEVFDTNSYVKLVTTAVQTKS